MEKEGVRETVDETYSTLIGTMMHRMMEMILMSKDSLSRKDVVRNVLSEYLTDEFEGYRESFAKRMEEVYEVMHHGGYPQINGADQDILPVLLNADEVMDAGANVLVAGSAVFAGDASANTEAFIRLMKSRSAKR